MEGKGGTYEEKKGRNRGRLFTYPTLGKERGKGKRKDVT